MKSPLLVLLCGLTLVACQRLNPAYESGAVAASGDTGATSGTSAVSTSGPTPSTTTNPNTSGNSTTGNGEGTTTTPPSTDDGVTADESAGVEETGIGESSDSVGCVPPDGPPFVPSCDDPQCLPADNMSCIQEAEMGPVSFPQEICVQAGCTDDCDCQIPGNDVFTLFCDEGEGCSIDCSGGNPCPTGMVCNTEFQVCLSNRAYGLCDETCDGSCYTDFQGTFEVCVHTDCNTPFGADSSLCPPPPSGAAIPVCGFEIGAEQIGCVLLCTFDDECPGDMGCTDDGACVHLY
ncbi:MAG: hypothetical protein AAF799_29200 [Myxococcota bacterium]